MAARKFATDSAKSSASIGLDPNLVKAYATDFLRCQGAARRHA